MDKVILQAELLGEAILESEEYISMRLAEQAVIDNEEAQKLIQTYTERKDAMQQALSAKPLNHEAMAKAGEAVKEAEELIGKNPLINLMRDKSADYSDMMQQVNAVIAQIINGEPADGCGGSCDSCGGSCSCGH